MRGSSILAAVLVAACVFFSGCPGVEACSPRRWPHKLEPLPKICGTKFIVNNRAYEAPDVDDAWNRAWNHMDMQLPEEHETEHPHSMNNGNTPGSTEPEAPSKWLVQIAGNAAGALISPRHVITLLSCIKPYRTSFPFPPGYHDFAVEFSGQQIPWTNIQEQVTWDYRKRIAVLTLAENNVTKLSSPVCVGSHQADQPSTAMTWSKDALLQAHPVTVYPDSHCSLYGVRNNYTLCTSTGPMMCGSPLVQVEEGRWALVGLGTGNVGHVATYRHLGPKLKWPDRIFIDI